MARRQFVLDKRTNRILNRLASEGAGNYSAIVRRGIELVANEEAVLAALERDPAFHRMMDESDRAEREGRWISHDALMRKVRARRRKAS